MRLTFLLIFLFTADAAFGQVAHVQTMAHNDVDRVHYLYVPPDAAPEIPLVIALHGMGGNAKNLRFGIGLTRMAEQLGFAVAYPQGIRLPQGSRHWNAGFALSDVDDTGYLSALIKTIKSDHDIGPVFVFGISMGGFMAYHMACATAVDVAGIVSVIGTMSASDWQECPSGKPVSILHIHGQLDPLVPYQPGSDFQAFFAGGTVRSGRHGIMGGKAPSRTGPTAFE